MNVFLDRFGHHFSDRYAMASNYRTDIFLKKLYYIHEQCASARKKKEEEEAEANMDDFTRLRKKIAGDIREAKELIHERNVTNQSGESDAVAAKQNNDIRMKFKDIRGDIDQLAKLQRKRQKKVDNQKEPSEEDVDACKMEAEVVEYAKQHMKELERMERFGDDLEQAGLFQDDDDVEPTVHGGIPDIDDPQFQALIQGDKELDQDLDEILEALKNVRQIAEAMNEELKVQEELVNKVDDSMEKVEERLTTVNASLKKVLKKVRGPRQFCCDICLCCVILGVGAAIIYLLVK